MRILHIIDNLEMGGANALLVNLAPAQKQHGHFVEVLQLVEAKDKTLINKLLDRGVDVNSISKDGTLYNPYLIFKIKDILANYDIIHVHLFPALYWCGLAKKISKSSASIIYTEHSTYNRRRSSVLLKAIDHYFYKNCYDKVIACSDKVAETFSICFPDIPITTIPNGVDISQIKKASSYSKESLLEINENVFIVTMVARFASMKRQDTIVEALNLLPSDVHAIFVGGDGGTLQSVKNIVYNLGLEKRVHFLGIRSDVPNILRTSDVIIMASDYEGLSLSSIEGMAAGKPFIASNVNGLKEVIGGAGLLYENKNATELASLIQQLYSDSSFYHIIAEKCIKRASEYDISKCAKLYENIYCHDEECK